MVTTKALVISAKKFQDTSLIAKCFTEELGTQSYLLKGVLKPSKNGLKAAYFQPLMQLEIVVTNQQKAKLEYIKEAKVLYHYQSLYSDFVKNAVASFLAEVCHFIVNDELPNAELFHFLQSYLQWFDKNDNPNFHLKFLIDLTHQMGVYPDVSSLNNTFFDVEDGVFVNHQNGHYLIDEQNTHFLKEFLTCQLAQTQQIAMNRTQRNLLLGGILKYYQWHLPSFREPKSLQIIRELFR